MVSHHANTDPAVTHLSNTSPAKQRSVFARSCFTEDGNNHWFAAKTYSNREFTVADSLTAQSIDCYLPIVTERRVWADRIKTIKVPLFRNYIFVNVEPLLEEFWKVSSTRGVASILGDGHVPIPVKVQELDSVSRMLEAGMVQVGEGFHPGERVRVKAGPLKGIEGRFFRINRKDHLAVHVTMLGQTVLAEVDIALVEKC
jgi:transcriptional antiterminator RfaH